MSVLCLSLLKPVGGVLGGLLVLGGQLVLVLATGLAQPVLLVLQRLDLLRRHLDVRALAQHRVLRLQQHAVGAELDALGAGAGGEAHVLDGGQGGGRGVRPLHQGEVRAEGRPVQADAEIEMMAVSLTRKLVPT